MSRQRLVVGWLYVYGSTNQSLSSSLRDGVAVTSVALKRNLRLSLYVLVSRPARGSTPRHGILFCQPFCGGSFFFFGVIFASPHQRGELERLAWSAGNKRGESSI
ncbi:hypothetical protein L228DRAFT_157771 [Xylona heveae TC161]|uniref:Uncharacterized protein n=1 Tax=Xylona heveae (strain CBS 132557 / TC161) TaxID=1328760 RepID=A0A165G344_XYLHT|nr:hypothetical protein L228DRAFT_157771 [Xylona heveae TC161]KZF21684.1 hypothetical protein L228DRAFT_157771 [Xylona heveae TC161]